MEWPLAVIRCRAHVRRALFAICTRLAHLFAVVAVVAAFPLTATVAHAAAPQLWLPTPPGERWKVIQGYACGTHNSWDRYALDLVNLDGPTYGAPIRAAADGRVFVWEAQSGTLILDHGGGFYTQYTHLSATLVGLDVTVKRGEVIGKAGDRGAHGTPHLHFHAFTADGAWANNRKTVPLSFAEGYELGEIGGCSQHQGQVLTAGSKQEQAIASLQLASELAANDWSNHDLPITFVGTGLAGGYSFAWSSDPGGAAPAQGPASSGQAALAASGEGLHTLFVRGWDANGQQSLYQFGPFGYDTTAPVAGASVQPQTVAANTAGAIIHWNSASDNASGVAGYRVYLGSDLQGSADWFVAATEASTPALAPGSYVLRIQPIDYAGNAAAWASVGEVVAK